MSDDEFDAVYGDFNAEEVAQLDRFEQHFIASQANQARPNQDAAFPPATFQTASHIHKKSKLVHQAPASANGFGPVGNNEARPTGTADTTDEILRQRQEIEDLRRQLMAKDGEISTIRRVKAQEDARQLQTTQNFQEQLKRKDEEKKRMQEDFRRDTERMRTANVFQRHEQETANARHRAQRHQQTTGKGKTTPTKPVAPRAENVLLSSPSMQRTKSLPPVQAIKPGFKGFNNAFVSNNVASTSKKVIDDCSTTPDVHEGFESEDLAHDNVKAIVGNNGIDLTQISLPDFAQRKRKVIAALFAHKTATQTGMITTVYGLMSSPLAPTVSIEQRHLKDVICTKLCSAFSDEHSANGKNQDHATDEQSYLQTVVDIGAALSDLTALFTAAKALDALQACLNLVSWILTHCPDMVQYFFGHPRFGAYAASAFPKNLAEIAANLARPTANVTASSFDNESTASLLSVLDALSCLIDEESHGGMEVFLAHKGAVANILHLDSPPDLLYRALLCIQTLASHAGLFRALVSAPLTAFDSQIPLVEHLAYLVSHKSPHSCKADYWRINMCSINILGLLCVQHSDALTLVGQPNQLLGNLVSVIHSDVTTLYQSIEERALPLLAIDIIRRIESAIRLLVFVCASPNAKINLRTKLQAISGIFPGIQQQFSLAFARLAYADPPDWLSPSEKNAIIEMEGPVQGMLDLVLSPDEQDSLYATFGGSEDSDGIDEADTNEEELAMMAAEYDDGDH